MVCSSLCNKLDSEHPFGDNCVLPSLHIHNLPYLISCNPFELLPICFSPTLILRCLFIALWFIDFCIEHLVIVSRRGILDLVDAPRTHFFWFCDVDLVGTTMGRTKCGIITRVVVWLHVILRVSCVF